MSSVSENNLERKFQNVSNTQDSIQSFSLWIIHHKSHSKKIVDVWIKVIRKTKISHRLTLLYLANDVIQNAKRKGAAQFAEMFFTVLPEATVLFRDAKIRGNVERVFNIWEDRSVFTADQVQELKRILNNVEETNDATSKVISEFKFEALTEKIRKTLKLQLETTSKLSALNGSKLDAANSEVLRQFKDRSNGQQFTRDFEEATRCLEEYIAALEREVAERTETIQLLEQAVVYYDTQRGEAKLVANAYKSFSNRITAQKKKLEGLINLLPSPFPSPCADAPSPSMSEEALDLVPQPTVAFTFPVTVDPVAFAFPVTADRVEEDAPSPVGSPEGLELSPRMEESIFQKPMSEVEELKLTPPVVSTSSSITVASFLGTQGAGLMSSWLEAFNTPTPVQEDDTKLSSSETKAEDSLDSRLNSRLLNLMQSMPSSLPTALLSGVGGDTPVKDEWASGQDTPVQDEDESPQNDLLKQLGRYSSDSPSQPQWPSALPPNPIEETPIELSPVKNSPKPVEKVEEPVVVKPLLPPPKPSFLELLSSPPKSASSPGPVVKTKPDPRRSSPNCLSVDSPAHSTPNSSSSSTTTNSKTTIITTNASGMSQGQGSYDSEPMDMDLGESDDEDTKQAKRATMVVTSKTSDTVVNRTTAVEVVAPQTTDAEQEAEKEPKEQDHKETSNVEEKSASYSTYRSFNYNNRNANHMELNKHEQPWKADSMECSRIETVQSMRNDDWRSPPWDDGPPVHHNYRNTQNQQQQHQFHPHPYNDRRQYERGPHEQHYGRGLPPPMVGPPKRFPQPFNGRGGRGYFMPRY